MVRPELVQYLPTKMRRLNEWYLKAAKKNIIDVMARVKEEHYFQEYGVHTSRKGGNGAPPLVPVDQKPVLKGALAPVVLRARQPQPFSTG